MKEETCNKEARTLQPSEIPCLTIDENWPDFIPAVLKEPALELSEASGEAAQNVIAILLSLVSSLLRHRRLIRDCRGVALAPELSALLVHPAGFQRVPWFDTTSRIMLNRDSIEQAMLQVAEEGERMTQDHLNYVARESMVLTELSPYGLEQKFDMDSAPNVLLHNLSTSLVDELDRLSSLEKRDISRLLNLAWNNDTIGKSSRGMKPGLSLLWSVSREELPLVYQSLLSSQRPAPVLMLPSTSRCVRVAGDVLLRVDAIEGVCWGISQGALRMVDLTEEAQKKCTQLISQLEVELTGVATAQARRHLTHLPSLFYKLLLLLNLFKTEGDKCVVDAAFKLLAVLTHQHIDCLAEATAGFTAPSPDVPDNPAEVMREYELLARIEQKQPVKRAELYRSYSTNRRKMLNKYLSRLIRSNRVSVDPKGRLSVRSLVSD